MKIISYLGAESECIVIQKPTDIYPLLDWCQSKMIDNEEECGDSKNKEEWEKATHYLSKLMDQVERDGFGSQEDVDNIEY